MNSNDLFEIARILGKQTDFPEVLRLVAHNSAQFLKADLALILMLNPDTRETVKTMIKDGKSIEQKEYRDIHIHVGGWIVNNCKPFFSQNIQGDDRFVKGLFDKVPIKSVAGVPLVIEGITIGALILLYQEFSEVNNENAVKPLENLAAISAPFLRNTQKIRAYFDSVLPESSLLQKYNNFGLYGKAPRFIELLHAIEAAARCEARVLLVGKTGTGKELIANAIYRFSSRENGPFVAVDCGAIPQTLLESEFFGHSKGAFTGAHADRQGLFLKANNGTFFLDEINNLPYDMQSKLLRVIEDGAVRPVGSDEVLKTDVRIIAAASTSLKELVTEKKFREDLFYRLHVFPIYVPALAERVSDIPLLANHFLHQYTKRKEKKAKHFHEEVIDFIKQRTWDGNIRELENFVERLITLTPKEASLIDIESFPADLREELYHFREKQKRQKHLESLKGQVQNFEAQLIKQTLIDCNWNQSEAARRLETSEKNIRYKIIKLNIQKPEIE